MQRHGVRWGAWPAAAVGLLAVAGGITQAATITGVSPQGEVAQVRQVAVRFSDAVVAFGDPRLPDPVNLSCTGAPPAGSGRWVDDRRWVYDFREAVPPGTRCTVKLRAGWAPQAAAGPLTGRTEFGFSTGGPAIVQVSPYDGATIEEDQHLLLQLNGPVVEATVPAHAWCEVEGLGERQPVQLLSLIHI